MIKISLEEWVEFLKEKSANKAEYLKNSRNSKGYSSKKKQKSSLSSWSGIKVIVWQLEELFFTLLIMFNKLQGKAHAKFLSDK